jgi:hypothetical protein
VGGDGAVAAHGWRVPLPAARNPGTFGGADDPRAVVGAARAGMYGLGLIVAGLCRPDPAFGFPPGTPAGPAAGMSTPARLHDLAALVVFGCLVGATVVFARRFGVQGIRGPATAALGVAVLVLVVVAMNPDRMGEALRAAVLVGWGWASWLAVHLRASLPARLP